MADRKPARVIVQDGKMIVTNEDGSTHTKSTGRPRDVFGGFRKFPWGSGIQDVREGESSKPILEDESFLMFDGNIMGLDVVVAYNFESGKLTWGSYAPDTRSSVSAAVEFFLSFDNALSTKYGPADMGFYGWDERLNGRSLSTVLTSEPFDWRLKWEFSELHLSVSIDNRDGYHAVAFYQDPLLKKRAADEMARDLDYL